MSEPNQNKREHQESPEQIQNPDFESSPPERPPPLKRIRLSIKQMEDKSKPPVTPKNNVIVPLAARTNDHIDHHKNGLHRNNQLVSSAQTQHNAPRKIQIKNLRAKPQLSEEYFESLWTKLRQAVEAIHLHSHVGSSLEELYQAVENLCSNKQAQLCYDRLRDLLELNLRRQLPRVLRVDGDSADQNDIETTTLVFLRRMVAVWNEFCNEMIMIRSIFLFLDRTYVLQNPSMFSLWDLGLDLFRSIIVNHSTVQERTVNGLLEMIQDERKSIQQDRGLIKDLLRMLSSLQIYQQVFERKFLSASQSLYSAEGRQLIQTMDVESYLNHVDKRLREEYDRLNLYLDFSTRKELISVVERWLIAEHITELLNRGLDDLLEKDKRSVLSVLYQLFGRTKNGQTELKNSLICYIKKAGKSLVMNPDRDKTMVQELLEFKENLDAIINECFENNEKYLQAQKDSFDYFINQRPNKPAELIAKYMDGKLRSGNKELTEEELEAMMDRVIVLFRFIQGKDVFEAFYKKDLAKRLLLGRSASVDAEKLMLTKLKQECGAGFTTKLEGMFKDMDLSKELGHSFKQTYQKSVNFSWPNIDFTSNVLTMGYWPTYTAMGVIIPPQLLEYQEAFTKFYMGKHSGRKLTWQPTLGQCLLKARFKENVVKELQVSLFQALVLLRFNFKDDSSFKEIQENTNIEISELKRTLQSLACGKMRVIAKTPKGKDVDDTDTFRINSDFNDRLYRIKISQIQMKETEEEVATTTEQVFQDRQYQIDAAIVRIMKMRKNLQHNQLITELFNQLRFPAKPSDLKKRIESLIDREYISRDKEDSNMYSYIA